MPSHHLQGVAWIVDRPEAQEVSVSDVVEQDTRECTNQTSQGHERC
jgi:hypothetical protein